jgi:hypothetical protein
MAFEYQFDVPKHNILKLGKEFDLDTLSTDNYQIIILSNVTGLTVDDLDLFDTALQAHESNPLNYDRTNVTLQLNESATGYEISVSGSSVTIPISSATISGFLIINEDTTDVLSACLDTSTISLTDDYTIVFGSPIWTIGETS